jgi:CubicO group peptidase (beta-lactamase class C family)
LFLLVWSVVASRTNELGGNGHPPGESPFVDTLSLLQEHAPKHSVPGAALGVLRGDALSTAYFGVAEVSASEPVTADTRFAVGSLCKSMVATAIARLAATGGLAFDDPIAAHVPELRGAAWAEADTLRDLLANRSRVPLRDALESGASPDEGDDVLSRYAAAVASARPRADFWSYTNAGWCLLGRALETATGSTWEEAMRVVVFDPLGMEDVAFATAAPAEPRATGHSVTAEGPVPAARWSPRSLGPAGSTLLCTLSDVLRFARTHLEEPSLAELRSAHAEIRIHAWLDAWCLGLARFDWPGGPAWGWDGVVSGQRAILRLVPGRGAAVLLSNADSGRALYRSLFAELMPEAFGVDLPPLALEPSRKAVGELSRFAGVYAWPDSRFDVAATDAGLRIEGDGDTMHASALDERTFLVDPDNPDSPSMTFDGFDENGRPTVLYDGLWGLPRV